MHFFSDLNIFQNGGQFIFLKDSMDNFVKIKVVILNQSRKNDTILNKSL